MQRASDEESAFAFKLSSRTQPRRIQSGRCEVRRVDSGGVRTDSRHRRTCCCFFGVRRSASRTPVASVGNRNSTPLCVAQASACVHCLCFRCHPEERILRSRSPQCGLRRRLPEDLASALLRVPPVRFVSVGPLLFGVRRSASRTPAQRELDAALPDTGLGLCAFAFP